MFGICFTIMWEGKVRGVYMDQNWPQADLCLKLTESMGVPYIVLPTVAFAYNFIFNLCFTFQ